MANELGTTFLSNPALRENLKVSAMMLAKANNMPLEKVDIDRLTQGYLRSPIDLTTNVSQLIFPMSTLDQQTVNAPVTPLTSLVPSPDVFICGSLSYYLMTYQFLGGQQSPDFTTSNSNFMPVTYVSSWENNGTLRDWDMGCAMFWLADLKIEVNSIVLYKKWDLGRHYYCPQSQATPLVPGSAYMPGQKNQFDFGGDSFYPMEPLPVISGSKATTVTLNLPANIPTTISPFNLAGIGYGTTFIAKAVFHGRGVMAFNYSGLNN